MPTAQQRDIGTAPTRVRLTPMRKAKSKDAPPKALEALEKNPLVRLRSALAVLQKHHRRMTLAQAATFLSVALWPGKTMREYSNITGLPVATISRQLLDLGSVRRLRSGAVGSQEMELVDGFGLIESETDAKDLRFRYYHLTREGKSLATLLNSVMEH